MHAIACFGCTRRDGGILNVFEKKKKSQGIYCISVFRRRPRTGRVITQGGRAKLTRRCLAIPRDPAVKDMITKRNKEPWSLSPSQHAPPSYAITPLLSSTHALPGENVYPMGFLHISKGPILPQTPIPGARYDLLAVMMMGLRGMVPSRCSQSNQPSRAKARRRCAMGGRAAALATNQAPGV